MLLAICAGNSPVPGEFPTQRPVTRSFDIFFDLRLNKRLSKNNRETGDLRCRRSHYDIKVMDSQMAQCLCAFLLILPKLVCFLCEKAQNGWSDVAFGIWMYWNLKVVHCRAINEMSESEHGRYVVLKIRTICHAWDLWKLAQSCKQLHLLCPPARPVKFTR